MSLLNFAAALSLVTLMSAPAPTPTQPPSPSALRELPSRLSPGGTGIGHPEPVVTEPTSCSMRQDLIALLNVDQWVVIIGTGSGLSRLTDVRPAHQGRHPDQCEG